MSSDNPTPARGRPRTLTPERILDAGIRMGLPNITFVGLAAALGVSHMALYKRVPGLAALKHMVAEEIFQRWQIPPADKAAYADLQDYLRAFVASLRDMVKANPGLTPYLLRRTATTAPMLAKINAHHRGIAQAWGIAQDKARWLAATIAFHGIAVADTIYSFAGRAPELATQDTKGQTATANAEEAELEQEFTQGMDALILGALACIQDAAATAAPAAGTATGGRTRRPAPAAAHASPAPPAAPRRAPKSDRRRARSSSDGQ